MIVQVENELAGAPFFSKLGTRYAVFWVLPANPGLTVCHFRIKSATLPGVSGVGF
jgi:hypothetical protein